MHSPANLRIDVTQIWISALCLARTMGRHMGCHPRRDGHPGGGCTILHHAGTHVGCSRTDTATQTTQIEISGSQVGSKIAAAIVRRIEQPLT